MRCLFFLPLPILGLFTSTLDGVVGGGLTWAWIYAFAQFAVAHTGQSTFRSLRLKALIGVS
ncbi:hypothetical protein [Streptomyces sporangiiformans]|uniref:Uncharacterized protein n=1 Tax=Streptomyces sporangiiformans TaxID=2315329 RepID=A0A505D6S6_9ACTN|nr:hypothetical protein [Streptomyces sporangiiformans]TPQ17972.1 hypothetical protein FGD71_033715 [Streptomyces sporangiiformans]